MLTLSSQVYDRMRRERSLRGSVNPERAEGGTPGTFAIGWKPARHFGEERLQTGVNWMGFQFFSRATCLL